MYLSLTNYNTLNHLKPFLIYILFFKFLVFNCYSCVYILDINICVKEITIVPISLRLFYTSENF